METSTATDLISAAKWPPNQFSVAIFICIINTYLKWYFEHFIKKFRPAYRDTQNSIKLNCNELQIHSLRRSSAQIKGKSYYTTKTVEN